jgi:secreted trypsin-like serine protease
MRVILLLCLAVPVFCDNVDKFVVGGSNANIANYPWQISLRVNNGHSCGASLISGVKGVTAAHCGGGALGTYSTLTGTTDRTVTNCGTCALRSLTSFVRHGSFVNNGNQGYPNDIATLRFANVPTNANTNYVTMAAANAGNYAGNSCIITGWGRTSSTSALPTTLQQGTMTVLTNAACASSWSSAQINNGHICVSANSVSACSGDSGGPLVCSNTLVGATSWGQAQCNPSFPSVYSRISFFRTWIDSN